VLRLEQTVQGFLDFARPPALQRRLCDVRDVVQRGVDLVRARARQQKVQIDTRCPEAPALAEVDAGQLCTVLVNLFVNALDAMPRGGSLAVRLGASPAGVRLTVTDTGEGISAAVAGRLFTPFASTKPTGCGLGLSISRRIIEEHGGGLAASNAADGGACFTITLPATAEPGGESHAGPASD
jgi:signal transduction histidine kinase